MAIGYTDFIHLAPACAGAVLFATGMLLTFPEMLSIPSRGKDTLRNPG